jgi:hypothetical protein
MRSHGFTPERLLRSFDCKPELLLGCTASCRVEFCAHTASRRGWCASALTRLPAGASSALTRLRAGANPALIRLHAGASSALTWLPAGATSAFPRLRAGAPSAPARLHAGATCALTRLPVGATSALTRLRAGAASALPGFTPERLLRHAPEHFNFPSAWQPVFLGMAAGVPRHGSWRSSAWRPAFLGMAAGVPRHGGRRSSAWQPAFLGMAAGVPRHGSRRSSAWQPALLGIAAGTLWHGSQRSLYSMVWHGMAAGAGATSALTWLHAGATQLNAITLLAWRPGLEPPGVFCLTQLAPERPPPWCLLLNTACAGASTPLVSSA